MSTEPNVEADQGDALAERVRAAHAAGTALRIVGSGSKAHLGRAVEGEALAVGGHRGILSFEPTELVLTARAGTALADIESALAEAGQMLPCEPPRLTGTDTFGGLVACGLSGPRRPFGGALRDLVLGTRIINGRGQVLRFGGEVIKNVAGYDVSRLMVGAQGTLGVLLDISVKVLPRPACECTRVLEMDDATALARMDALAGQPLPLSALAHHEGRLHVRLSGTAAGVRSAAASLGGEALDDDGAWWAALRDRRLALFSGDAPLWRLALPAGTPALTLDGEWLLDWGGTQRWLRGNADAAAVRAAARAHGGHATCVQGVPGDPAEPFEPLPDALLALHRRIKAAFDPQHILNPGRLYAPI